MTRHCEHVKSNGHFCGSPAMRDRNYCYFHLNYVGRKLRAEKQALAGRFFFELPLLEDAASIQIALMQVTNSLLYGLIDPKRAGLVLYALQTASSNLRNMEKEAKNEEASAVCNSYETFEQDYDLEDHTELRVDEAAAQDPIAAAEAAAGCKIVPLSELSEPYAHRGKDPGRDPETGQKYMVIEDPAVELPWRLTKNQYLDAQCRIFQYEMEHDIDKTEKARQAAPQRAAISQKLSLGLRKPPQPFTWPQDETVVGGAV